jgi:hypothetical protein
MAVVAAAVTPRSLKRIAHDRRRNLVKGTPRRSHTMTRDRRLNEALKVLAGQMALIADMLRQAAADEAALPSDVEGALADAHDALDDARSMLRISDDNRSTSI